MGHLAELSVKCCVSGTVMMLNMQSFRTSQIEKEMGAFSRSSRGVSTCIVVGGVNMSEQRGMLRGGVEIVVATPGRFIDHLQQRNTALNRVSLVVLDEADRMLDMGFEPSIAEIMASLPPRHQTLLFSATMPVEIEELANRYFSNPVRLKVRTFNMWLVVEMFDVSCQCPVRNPQLWTKHD